MFINVLTGNSTNEIMAPEDNSIKIEEVELFLDGQHVISFERIN